MVEASAAVGQGDFEKFPDRPDRDIGTSLVTNAQSLRRATAVANAQNMPAAVSEAATFDDAQSLRRATTVANAQNVPVASSAAPIFVNAQSLRRATAVANAQNMPAKFLWFLPSIMPRVCIVQLLWPMP